MIDVIVPRETVNDQTVVIGNIFVTSGKVVKKGQVVVAIETSKTNIDIASPNDGIVFHNLMTGQEIRVGLLLFSIMEEHESSTLENNTVSVQIKESASVTTFSKAAQKRMEELKISPELFNHGLVSVEQVEKKAGIHLNIVEQEIDLKPFTKFKPIDKHFTPFTEKVSSKRKRAEIDSLLSGDHAATTSTIGIKIKTPGMRLIEPPFLFKMSISDLIVYESSKLLRVYPELNGSYIDTKSWAKFDEVNFGISFDTGANLKVLTIRNTEKFLLTEVQTKIQELLDLYESGETIAPELLTSSTVTLSDLSTQDTTFMLPLINGKQSLILGVVRYSKNHFGIYASFDHRLAEGLTVSKFLAQLKIRILSYYLDENSVANIFCHACEKTMHEELSLNNKGLIKITLPNGDDGNLCRNCFEGY